MGFKDFIKQTFGVKAVVERQNNQVHFAQVPGNDGVYKAHIPNFLYKPPFGYPRGLNIPYIRKLAKNGYVHSVVQTIADQIATQDWEICVRKGYDVPEERVKQITEFFLNPNSNHESFNDILKMVTTDILEVDAGVMVKVFNLKEELVELYARDGGTFLKNPDIFGTVRDKQSIIFPSAEEIAEINAIKDSGVKMSTYQARFASVAAWYQYGWTAGSIPIPFGKDEIIYCMRNPRSDSIYGRSPLEILGEILYVLIYGSSFYLDYYLNNNMPEGGIVLEGAQQEEMLAFKERFEGQFRRKDAFDNTRKEFFKYPIYNRPMEFVKFSVSPEEMGVIEQQKWFIKLFWSCFGITPSEMGFTDDSNRATEHGQNLVVKRKVIKPLIQLLEYKINNQIIPYFDTEGVEFKFKQYDIDEEIKKNQLYQMQISMGIKTAEMVAEEEGVNIEELKNAKQEKYDQELELTKARSSFGFGESNAKDDKGRLDSKVEDKKVEQKAVKKPTLNEIEDYIERVGEKIIEAFDDGKISGI